MFVFITWVLILSACLFILLNIAINYALFRSFTYKSPEKNNQVMFSVVVAAKNESRNIGRLVTALDKQNFPRKNFEVILVDDNSEDNTFDVIREHIKDKNNFLVMKAKDKPFPAKKGALAKGIGQSKNPHIIITDADCVPEKDWLKSFASGFSEGHDFLFGTYSFHKTGSFVNAVSRFNAMRSAFLTFSAAEAGKPYSANACSFAFRKDAFNNIGGYGNTLQTLSGDDDLLIREAVKNNYRIGTVTAPQSKIHTDSKESLNDYLVQKARHTSASNYYLPFHKTMLALWHLLNIVFLLSPVLCVISPYFISLFLLKLITDIITVTLQQKKFGYRFNLIEILYLQAVYEILLIVNYLNSFSSNRNKWK